MKSPKSRVSILVLGTADWNQAIATNQHYAVRELAKQFDVTYIESMGLRRPELKLRDLRRIWSRLSRRSNPGTRRPLPDHVQVKSPLTIPLHRRPFTIVNRWLLRRLVRDWLATSNPRVLWAYTPVTYGLETSAPTVYHCVDLLGAQSGIDSRVIARAERRLAASGAVAGASSEVVQSHLRKKNFTRVESWPNVADLEVFVEGVHSSSRQPRAVFAGNLTDTKVDFKLLREVLDSGVHLVLAGPVSEGGGSASDQVEDLVAHGADYRGMLALPELADLFRSCSVGLIPYLLNDYTRGVNPLKTFEYLSAGLAVVSTAVPAVRDSPPDARVTEGGRDFVNTVRDLIGVPDSKQIDSRLALSSRHGWNDRGRAMRHLVQEIAP